MSDLNEFVEWVKEKPDSRTVSIDIENENRFSKEPKIVIKVWAYDYTLQRGQHVSSVSEINLEAEKEREEKAEFDRLKAKFGGV